eukprot:836814-Pleurochrysis_carterae.AAC.1
MLADRFGAHLDTELSTQKGIVVVKGDEVYVAFRGAQANAPRPELQSYTDTDKINIKRAPLGKRLDLSGEEAIVRGAMEKYGQVDGVYGYSLGGHKIADLARRGVLEG